MLPLNIEPNTIFITDSDDIVPDPLPTIEVAEFLAWLMKRGYIWPIRKCESKCRQIGIDLQKDVINPFCPDKIIIGRISGGDIVVKIKDRSWAQQVTDHYDMTLPHHSFPTLLP